MPSFVSPCLVTALSEIKPTSHQFICYTQRKLNFLSWIGSVFLIISTFARQQRRFFITPYSACRVRGAIVFLSFKRFLVDRRRRLKCVTVLGGCAPFVQSESGFCDPKFDFSLHRGLNQSKIAIWTIHLRTWIVQIGISIWFQIFVPFNETAFRSQELARSSIMTLVQAKVIYTPPLFYAAKGLWYIKLKFHCNPKSVRKRKRLDFLTDLKLSNVCVQTLTTKDCKGPQTNMP